MVIEFKAQVLPPHVVLTLPEFINKEMFDSYTPTALLIKAKALFQLEQYENALIELDTLISTIETTKPTRVGLYRTYFLLRFLT